MSKKLFTVGIDLALTGKHKAAIIGGGNEKPHYLRPFYSQPDELSSMLEHVRKYAGPDARIEFIMEPTSYAWYPVTRWLVARGYKVYLVRPEKVADLRRFLKKHAKTDNIDGKTLAMLGLYNKEDLYPARLLDDAHMSCDRLCRQRARFSAEMGSIKTRIKSHVGLAVPGLQATLSDMFNLMGIKILQRCMNPHTTVKLGFNRFAAMCEKARRGSIPKAELEKIYQTFVDASRLYKEAESNGPLELDFDDLQSEILMELDHLAFLEKRIQQLDTKIEALYEKIDPPKVLTSIRGVGPVIAAALTARIGNIQDFNNIGAFRSYCGLVPRKKQSSEKDQSGLRITKAGNRHLKQYLYMAAETARHWDPQFAQFYVRLRVEKCKHHKKAMVALANKMANRVYAVLKRSAANPEGEDVLYELRDLEGKAISKSRARQLALEILSKNRKERSAEAA